MTILKYQKRLWNCLTIQNIWRLPENFHNQGFFWIIKNFPDYPKTFQTIPKLSRRPGAISHPENFQLAKHCTYPVATFCPNFLRVPFPLNWPFVLMANLYCYLPFGKRIVWRKKIFLRIMTYHNQHLGPFLGRFGKCLLNKFRVLFDFQRENLFYVEWRRWNCAVEKV